MTSVSYNKKPEKQCEKYFSPPPPPPPAPPLASGGECVVSSVPIVCPACCLPSRPPVPASLKDPTTNSRPPDGPARRASETQPACPTRCADGVVRDAGLARPCRGRPDASNYHLNDLASRVRGRRGCSLQLAYEPRDRTPAHPPIVRSLEQIVSRGIRTACRCQECQHLLTGAGIERPMPAAIRNVHRDWRCIAAAMLLAPGNDRGGGPGLQPRQSAGASGSLHCLHDVLHVMTWTAFHLRTAATAGSMTLSAAYAAAVRDSWPHVAEDRTTLYDKRLKSDSLE